jgi:hypothetical protein
VGVEPSLDAGAQDRRHLRVAQAAAGDDLDFRGPLDAGLVEQQGDALEGLLGAQAVESGAARAGKTIARLSNGR